jgi:pilus assembly protein Flp/PilA
MKVLGDLFMKWVRESRYIVNSERGQTLVEYGLLVILIAVVVILMLKGTGQQVNSLYCKVNSSLTNP